MQYNLIVILGPTASGKTRLAARLAGDIGAEIISADSRQVYRGMDIGTGKDLADYVVNGKKIPHHLIDVVEPEQEFSVFEYQRLFFKCFKEISSRKVTPILVGGTGLYIESVLEGYQLPYVPVNPEFRREAEESEMETLVKRLLAINPSVHNTTDLKDRSRLIRAIEIAEYIGTYGPYEAVSMPRIMPLVTGIQWERSVLRRRITERLQERLKEGMIEEVKRLHDSGIGWDKFDYFGLEYRYIGLYLRGRIDYAEMFQKLATRIHQFAKRQETWFRRMERKGIVIHWFEGSDFDTMREFIKRHIGGSLKD
jgi:tRNA dimethylallyltransferase